MAETATLVRHRPPRRDDTPRVPHTAHLRELTMPDGRKLVLDRRFIGFICQGKPEDFDGKTASIIAFKGWAKPIPVIEGFHDLKSWWRIDVMNQSNKENSNG
jgi:hypothetical protein